MGYELNGPESVYIHLSNTIIFGEERNWSRCVAGEFYSTVYNNSNLKSMIRFYVILLRYQASGFCYFIHQVAETKQRVDRLKACTFNVNYLLGSLSNVLDLLCR